MRELSRFDSGMILTMPRFEIPPFLFVRPENEDARQEAMEAWKKGTPRRAIVDKCSQSTPETIKHDLEVAGFPDLTEEQIEDALCEAFEWLWEEGYEEEVVALRDKATSLLHRFPKIIPRIQKSNLNRAIQLAVEGHRGVSFELDPSLAEQALQEFICNKPRAFILQRVLEKFPASETVKNSAETRQALLEINRKTFDSHDDETQSLEEVASEMVELVRTLSVTENQVRESGQALALSLLSNAQAAEMEAVRKAFHIEMGTQLLEEAAKEGYEKALEGGVDLSAYVATYNIDPSWVKTKNEELVRKALDRNIFEAIHRSEQFGISEEVFLEMYVEIFPENLRGHLHGLITEWIKKMEPTKDKFLVELACFKHRLTDFPWILEKLVDPTVKAQGVGSFRFLEQYNKLWSRPFGDSDEPNPVPAIESEQDVELLREIVATQGVRAIDTLFFVVEGVRGKELFPETDDEGNYVNEDAKSFEAGFLLRPLSRNTHLPKFLTLFPAVNEIYKEYAAIESDTSHSALEREQSVRLLQAEVKEKQLKIVSGTCSDEDLESSIYAGLAYHTFPPATTLDRTQYINLLRRREDRQKDLPKEWTGLNGKETVLSVGAYELKEGEVVDTGAWDLLQGVIEQENKKDFEQIQFSHAAISALGEKILSLLASPKELTQKRGELLSEIYRLHRFRDGVTLTEKLSTRDDLMQIKEYAGDRMRDIVDLVLKTYAETDPSAYDTAVKRATTSTLKEKDKQALIKSITGMLWGKHRAVGEEMTNMALKNMLKRAGVEVEGNVLDAILEKVADISNSDVKEEDRQVKQIVEEFLRNILEGGALQRQAGKLAVDIVQRLLGKEYVQMQEEMQKYEFHHGAEGGESKKIRFEISKKRGHAVAGLNMGVCVAVDEKLWNKESFSNVILWDEENVARGGMHFETVEDRQEKYLTLPGINPSTSLISSVDAERLYEEMIVFAKDAGRAIGAKALLIPTRADIHSNRTELQAVISKKNYKKMSLTQQHEFSYDPYTYSWQDAYVVEI